MLGAMPDRPTKISFGEMRDSGVRGILVYCADYHCSHSVAVRRRRHRESGPLHSLAQLQTCTRRRRQPYDVCTRCRTV